MFDIIQQLDPNKAHSHDMNSIRMLKICGNSIVDRWNWFSMHEYPILFSHLNGKRERECLFIRKTTGNVWKATVLSRYYRSVLLLPSCLVTSNLW